MPHKGTLGGVGYIAAVCAGVAAEERSEAAIEREAVVKPELRMYMTHRIHGFYDCCAADRSLAALLSGYKVYRQQSIYSGG